MGTGFGGKSKSGMGGLGTGRKLQHLYDAHIQQAKFSFQKPVAGGALGAAVGAYGGYQLGKMVGGLGRYGHYGYYDDRSYRYVRCDPPPKIETDPLTNITYIPKTITYDARCEYYDKEPPRIHPSYSQRGYYMNGQTTTCPTVLTTILLFISVLMLGFETVFPLNRFRVNGLSQHLLT